MESRKSFADVFENYSRNRILDSHIEQIKTEDEMVFSVHRFPLSRESKYFNELFSTNVEDQACVIIPGIQGKVLEDILIYLYTATIHLDEENMIPVLIAADYLIIEALIDTCINFVLLHMQVENCLNIFVIAFRIQRLGILEKCYRFVELHFERVVRHSIDALFCLPSRALKMFLGDKSLNVLGESTIWSVIEAWIKKNPSERSSVLELLNLICWQDVEENLYSEIISSGIFTDLSFSCEDTQKLSSTIFTNKNPILKYIQQLKAGNISRRLPSNLYFIFREIQGGGFEIFVTYDEKFDVWRKVYHFPAFYQFLLITIGELIYIFNSSGQYDVGESTGVLAFNVLTNEMIPVATVPGDYDFLCVVEVGGRIYAANGSYGKTDHLERYDPVDDVWYPSKPMLSVVVIEMVNYQGNVYVFGTTSEQPRTPILQVYEPSHENWTVVSAPNVRLAHLCAVVFRDNLYVMGNRYENERFSRDVEVYDPLSDIWNRLPEIPADCILPHPIVLKGKLYAWVFRFSLDLSNIITGRIYWNENRNEWQTISGNAPLDDLHHFSFCVQEDPDIIQQIVRKNRQLDTEWSKTTHQNFLFLSE